MLSRLVGDDVELAFELEPGVHPVRVDPAQIEQVLVNLVVNAADATPAGGRIVVRTANADVVGARRPAGRALRRPLGRGLRRRASTSLRSSISSSRSSRRRTSAAASASGSRPRTASRSRAAARSPSRRRRRRLDVRRLSPGGVCAARGRRAAAGAGETIVVVESDPAVRDVLFEVLSDAGYRAITDADARRGACASPSASTAPIDLVLTELDETRAAALAESLGAAQALTLQKPYSPERLRAGGPGRARRPNRVTGIPDSGDARTTIRRRPKCRSVRYRCTRIPPKLSRWMFRLSEEELERRVEERTAELVAALQKSEARFRALIENSIDVTAILDADMRVQYVSPSVTRILGYSADEITGAAVARLRPSRRRAMCSASSSTAAATSRASMQTEQFRARHKDGSWRLMDAVGLNLLDDPAVRGMVITARDVTARRALEERLRQSERLEAIGQLAGGVAHDFNNVLLVIRGYSSVLRASLTDPQHIADVDEIAKAADRAAELTRQLLAFGRRQVLEPRLLSLAEVVRSMQKLLAPNDARGHRGRDRRRGRRRAGRRRSGADRRGDPQPRIQRARRD